jgi:transcriptional regulator with XRE-family HTH domain
LFVLASIKKKLVSSTKSGKSAWRQDAEIRIKNKKWLRYSSHIARRILAVISERRDLNQKILAEKIGVKPQYINKVVKGQENLSLETISKISDALDIELIQFPSYKYNMAKPVMKDLPVKFIENGADPFYSVSTIETKNVSCFTKEIYASAFTVMA